MKILIDQTQIIPDDYTAEIIVNGTRITVHEGVNGQSTITVHDADGKSIDLDLTGKETAVVSIQELK